VQQLAKSSLGTGRSYPQIAADATVVLWISRCVAIGTHAAGADMRRTDHLWITSAQRARGKIREGLIVQNWPDILRAVATMAAGIMGSDAGWGRIVR